MNTDSVGSFLLLILPAAVFALIFHRSWRDGELHAAALAGCCAGALATVPVKFFAYPMISQLLGDDLSNLAAGGGGFPMKVASCIGLIGPIEETAKWCAAVGAVLLLKLECRAAAVFLAATGAGVGFSVVENLDYLSAYGPEVLFARSLFSTCGHVLFAGVAGFGTAIALSSARSSGRRLAVRGYTGMIAALFLAAFLHGMFNLIAFGLSIERSLPSLAFCLIAGLILLREGWIRVLVFDANSAVSLSWECAGCGLRSVGVERFCPECGGRVSVRA
ncbi:MAG: PrsW family intramembrane metalloprotease [Candidatus Riflebacteria bacterium]|nr:PrsW family intramembrane metalloprotease [Candidatus Riflebacteria bacterium]